MRTMTKTRIISRLFCFVLTVACVTGNPVNARIAHDQPEHWAYKTVMSLVHDGVIDNDDIALEHYDSSATRGIFTKWFMRMMKIPEQEYKNIYFSDVEPDSEYYQVTAQAKEHNLIMGFEDGTYKPEEFIQRQDLFTIIGRALERSDLMLLSHLKTESSVNTLFADEERIASYAKAYIHMLVNYGVIKGYEDQTVRPEETITFAEAAVIVHRVREMIQSGSVSAQDGTGTGVEPKPERTPRPARTPKTTKTPAPTPIPTLTPTPAKTTSTVAGNNPSGGSGGSGSGGGSNGNNSTNNGNNSSNNSNTDQNNNSNEPVSNDYFDETITADIDRIVPLKDLAQIQITSSLPDYIPALKAVNQKDLGLVVQYLRGLHLGVPIVQKGGAGMSYLITLTYRDGTNAELSLNGTNTLYYNGIHYSIPKSIEVSRFDTIIGSMMQDIYRKEGLFEITGTVTGPLRDDAETGRVYCDLIDQNGKTVVIDLTGGRLFDSRGSGHMLLSPDDEVTVYYRSQGFHQVRAIIITGPKLQFIVEELITTAAIVEMQIEISPFDGNETYVYTQPQAIDTFWKYMLYQVLSYPRSHEEAVADYAYHGDLSCQDAVKINLTDSNGFQSELTLIGDYIVVEGRYYHIVTPYTFLEVLSGDLLADLFALDGLIEVSGVFGDEVAQVDPSHKVYELTDWNGNNILVDITDAKFFDTRRNSDKTVLQQVKARVLIDVENNSNNKAGIVILYEEDI